jgi:hypothetical protein
MTAELRTFKVGMLIEVVQATHPKQHPLKTPNP